MSFYSKSFTYNNEPSEMYNLHISSIDESGAITKPASGNIEILDVQLFRRMKPYFYGTTFSGKFEFPIAFFSPVEIDAPMFSHILNWLFGQTSYKRLAVSQPDMDSFYINCLFTDAQAIRVGNLIYGVSGTCVADSQFAFTYPRSISYSYTSDYAEETFTFHNTSHYNGYLYPQISFTMNSLADGDDWFGILNYSDSDRLFLFNNLTQYESITVNNDLGIITSSLGLHRLSDFNKNFFRLVPGVNRLYFYGRISSFSMTYQFARRIGG